MDILDQLPCAVLVTDINGRVLSANADLLALTGRSAAHCKQLQIEAFLPAASRIFLQTHVWPSLLRDGRLNETYLQLLGPDQQRVPVMLNCRRGRFDGVEGYFWTFFVAQERQRFEAALLDARTRAEQSVKALAASERLLRSVAESIPGLMAYWDKDLRCRYANQAYGALSGKEPGALLGSHVSELPDRDALAVGEAPVRAVLAGQAQQFERTLALPDGELRHAWANLVPDLVNAEVVGFLVLVSDVTPLKRAEAALRSTLAERERAHVLLRESSAALQEAQRLGRIGSWSWQMADDIVSWSAELFRILGCDAANGPPSFAEQARLYLPESFSRLQRAVDQALHGGESYKLELEFVRPDGVHGWAEAHGEAVHDEQGRVARLQGTLQDITTRKLIEQALATESWRLANIIEGTQAGTWEWNVQTGQVKLNQRSAAMLGYTLAELGEQTIQLRVENTHPDDHRASQAAARKHFAGLTDVYESEARMRHRDGHWVWILARGRVMTRSAAGEPEWMFGTHLDITQRKQQEEALRKNQDMLDRTGRLAGVGGWELDLTSGGLSWSEQTRRMHGVAPDYRPDLASAIDFYAPEARPTVRAAVERAMRSGEPWDLELPLIRADGQPIWARAVGAAEFVDGQPVRLVGAFQDISERHALDQILAHKTAELERSNEELERFAYVASHDLQEPLRMVTSYGQLLTRRHLAGLPAEAREFVQFMIDGGQRAQALIRDLLSLARLDSQARPWQPVALEAVLAESLTQLALRLQETGAAVTHDPLPTVVADARQIGQLMDNLLGNALKFCAKQAPVVHVGAVPEGSGWRISVRDNGIGIEPRYFDRIFTMFQRLHSRTEYDGTGIGLAICKKVVERHGGQIGVASEPGQGSTFFFTLPDHGRHAGHERGAAAGR